MTQMRFVSCVCGNRIYYAQGESPPSECTVCGEDTTGQPTYEEK